MMQRRTIYTLTLTCLCGMSLWAAAAVRFNGYTVTSRGILGIEPARVRTAPANGAGLVGLQGPVTPAVKDALRAAGLQLVGYLPDNGYLVAFTSGYRRAALPEDVAFVYALAPEMKLGPAVMAAGREPEVVLALHLVPGCDLAAVVQQLDALDCDVARVVDDSRRPRIGVWVNPVELADTAAELARLAPVYYVERGRAMEPLLDQAVPIVQSGASMGGLWSMLDAGLDGSGQLVAVCDTGLDADSCYFRNEDTSLPPVNDATTTTVDLSRRKVVAVDFLVAHEDPDNLNDWDTQGHGTKVASCVGGNHVDFPEALTEHNNGVAPGCLLIAQDGGFESDDCADLEALGCPVIDLQPLFQQAYAQGARVHNNSWGDRENFSPRNLYSAGSQDVDTFTWNHRDMLVVFSAGNAGSNDDTVVSPSTAKNCLSVAATGNSPSADTITSYSSRGWASDGRIKPDLCAPGSNVDCAGSDNEIGTWNCSTGVGHGTSISSPIVAGCAALVRQYFAEGYYPTETAVPADGWSPSAALVKAMLLHSTLRLSAEGDVPGRSQGWGRVALNETLFDTTALYVQDCTAGFASSAAEPVQLLVDVTAGTPLEISLVYTDYPATMGASPQLVNNLDLVLKHEATTWYGNNWSNSASVAGGSADALNNVERILLPTPAAGHYYLKIQPTNIPEGPQDYALVVTGDVRVQTFHSSLLRLQ